MRVQFFLGHQFVYFFSNGKLFYKNNFLSFQKLKMGESRPDIPIPDGLQKLMQDFVVTVLRQQPEDLINHAVEYFNKLKVSLNLIIKVGY